MMMIDGLMALSVYLVGLLRAMQIRRKDKIKMFLTIGLCQNSFLKISKIKVYDILKT